MEQELAQRRERILAKAGEEARALVRAARQEAEDIIRELREKASREMARDREAAIQEARERLGRLRRKVNKAVPERTISGEVPTDLRPGEEVYLPKLNQRGYVLSPPGPGGEVQVQVGIMKISVPLKDLLRAEKTVQPGGQSQWGASHGQGQGSFQSWICRGLYADEAMQQVEKYLDDACLAGLSKFT